MRGSHLASTRRYALSLEAAVFPQVEPSLPYNHSLASWIGAAGQTLGGYLDSM